jgi:hypothetical protein
MSNTSEDNFERIAEDTMDLLLEALHALHSKERLTQMRAGLEIGEAAAEICKRAIVITSAR